MHIKHIIEIIIFIINIIFPFLKILHIYKIAIIIVYKYIDNGINTKYFKRLNILCGPIKEQLPIDPHLN